MRTSYPGVVHEFGIHNELFKGLAEKRAAYGLLAEVGWEVVNVIMTIDVLIQRTTTGEFRSITAGMTTLSLLLDTTEMLMTDKVPVPIATTEIMMSNYGLTNHIVAKSISDESIRSSLNNVKIMSNHGSIDHIIAIIGYHRARSYIIEILTNVL